MPTIEVTQPTSQYTVDSVYSLVQFQWRVAVPDGTPAYEWQRENYSPTQAQLSARAPANVLAVVPGYWGDAEVKADVLAHLVTKYGFTDVVFLDG